MISIQKFIKLNYQEMYLKWSAYSQQGFYKHKYASPLVGVRFAHLPKGFSFLLPTESIACTHPVIVNFLKKL